MLEQAEPKQRSVISEGSAAELTDMLEGVIKKGTGTRANIGRPAAGKTGTTSDYHDAWFVGYTPDLVCGVWVGNDDNTDTGGIMGGQLPAEIWKSFMQKALAQIPAKNFDGSSASKSDAIGELENDKKSEMKKKNETKQKNARTDKNGKPIQGNSGITPGPSQPADNSGEQPAMPDSAAPEPGGAVSKGRN